MTSRMLFYEDVAPVERELHSEGSINIANAKVGRG